jgi:hypothetical protein
MNLKIWSMVLPLLTLHPTQILMDRTIELFKSEINKYFSRILNPKRGGLFTFLSGGLDRINSRIIAWASFLILGGRAPSTITLLSL